MVGWLSSRSARIDDFVLPAFHKSLNAQGFVEDRNVKLEYRYAEGENSRLPDLAADLLRHRPAVIVAPGSFAPSARAIRTRSPQTPTIGFLPPDPISAGFVSSINRPGGSATGIVAFQKQVIAKRIGLLHDLMPQARVMVYLANPDEVAQTSEAEEVRDAARVLGVSIKMMHARTAKDLDTALASMDVERSDAVVFGTTPMFFTQMDKIVGTMMRLGVASSFWRREFTAAGGLMSYGSNADEAYRVLGDYAGRILKGEKAGDLPVQQPTKLEFVLNVNTAKALKLTIRPDVLSIADEVIE